MPKPLVVPLVTPINTPYFPGVGVSIDRCVKQTKGLVLKRRWFCDDGEVKQKFGIVQVLSGRIFLGEILTLEMPVSKFLTVTILSLLTRWMLNYLHYMINKK